MVGGKFQMWHVACLVHDTLSAWPMAYGMARLAHGAWHAWHMARGIGCCSVSASGGDEVFHMLLYATRSLAPAESEGRVSTASDPSPADETQGAHFL